MATRSWRDRCGALVRSRRAKAVCIIAVLVCICTGPLGTFILGPLRVLRPLPPLIPMPASDGGVNLHLTDEGFKESKSASKHRSGEGEEPGTWDEERVVELIRSLVHPRLSQLYKYDVCLFTVVRNEYYLKEFLVRNIIAGVQKIFLNDDSFQPWDTNVTNLVRPFVRAGVVEHRTRLREKRAALQQNQEMRDDWLQATLLQSGRDCTWIARLDSDEVVYPVDYPSIRLPTWLLVNENKHCEIRLPWVHPYNEGVTRRRGFALGETLLHSYPRMCFEHSFPKNFVQFHATHHIRPDVHESIRPLRARLRTFWPLTVYDKRLPGADPSPRPAHPILVHYYTKSLEDFVVKKEQSMGPSWRLFRNHYDGGTDTCRLQKQPFAYSWQYVADVERVMSVQFTEDPLEDSAGRTFEQPDMAQEQSGDDSDYDLYLYVKQQLRNRKWFNQSCYYDKYPVALDLVRQGSYTDALIHFVTQGFDEGKTLCWEDGEEVVFFNG